MSESMKPPIGSALAIVLGLIAWQLALRLLPVHQWEDGLTVFVPGIILAGIPVGAWLGWRFAQRVGRRNPFALIGWMAVSAVLLGDLEVSAAIAIGAAVSTGGPGIVAFVPFVFAIGLFFGLLVLPLTLPAAVLWFVTFSGLLWLVRLLHCSAAGPMRRPLPK